MSTLDQMRSGLERAWDSIAEGWSQLRRRASQAVTRFTPSARSGELETGDEQFLRHTARWGLLAAEVQENDEEVSVSLEVPGMEPDGFDLQVVEGNVLVIRGDKRIERQQAHGRFHIMECAYGRFERAIPLPAQVEESGARARYRRGVLRVTLPKSRASRARRIEVSQA